MLNLALQCELELIQTQKTNDRSNREDQEVESSNMKTQTKGGLMSAISHYLSNPMKLLSKSGNKESPRAVEIPKLNLNNHYQKNMQKSVISSDFRQGLPTEHTSRRRGLPLGSDDARNLRIRRLKSENQFTEKKANLTQNEGTDQKLHRLRERAASLETEKLSNVRFLAKNEHSKEDEFKRSFQQKLDLVNSHAQLQLHRTSRTDSKVIKNFQSHDPKNDQKTTLELIWNRKSFAGASSESSLYDPATTNLNFVTKIEPSEDISNQSVNDKKELNSDSSVEFWHDLVTPPRNPKLLFLKPAQTSKTPEKVKKGLKPQNEFSEPFSHLHLEPQYKESQLGGPDLESTWLFKKKTKAVKRPPIKPKQFRRSSRAEEASTQQSRTFVRKDISTHQLVKKFMDDSVQHRAFRNSKYRSSYQKPFMGMDGGAGGGGLRRVSNSINDFTEVVKANLREVMGRRDSNKKNCFSNKKFEKVENFEKSKKIENFRNSQNFGKNEKNSKNVIFEQNFQIPQNGEKRKESFHSKQLEERSTEIGCSGKVSLITPRKDRQMFQKQEKDKEVSYVNKSCKKKLFELIKGDREPPSSQNLRNYLKKPRVDQGDLSGVYGKSIKVNNTSHTSYNPKSSRVPKKYSQNLKKKFNKSIRNNKKKITSEVKDEMKMFKKRHSCFPMDNFGQEKFKSSQGDISAAKPLEKKNDVETRKRSCSQTPLITPDTRNQQNHLGNPQNTEIDKKGRIVNLELNQPQIRDFSKNDTISIHNRKQSLGRNDSLTRQNLFQSARKNKQNWASVDHLTKTKHNHLEASYTKFKPNNPITRHPTDRFRPNRRSKKNTNSEVFGHQSIGAKHNGSFVDPAGGVRGTSKGGTHLKNSQTYLKSVSPQKLDFGQGKHQRSRAGFLSVGKSKGSLAADSGAGYSCYRVNYAHLDRNFNNPIRRAGTDRNNQVSY